MKNTLIYIFVIAVVVSVMVGTFEKADSRSKSSLPQDRSGGPRDSISGFATGATCWNGCHNTFASPFARTGWISSDVPASGYVPGATYNITVSCNSKGYRHGFEASCQTSTGTFMGTLIKNDSTWIITAAAEPGKSWITQRDSSNAVQNVPPIPCMLGSIGTGGSAANFNTKSWTFQWIAPAAGSGAVSFYMAAVAANGNQSDNGLYDGSTWPGDSVFTSTLALTENLALNFTNVVKPTCAPNNNGSAQVNASYGTPPYTYSWNTTPVQTTQAANGLSAGTYTVVVTDALLASRTLTLTMQNAFNATISAQTVPTCPGGTGVATCTPTGGTSPYTYAWSPTGATTNTASVTTPLTLTVTASDAAGCSAIVKTTMVDQVPFHLYNFSWNVTNATCNGANNGYAKVSKVGGGTVTYAWNTTPILTTSSVSTLQPGTWKCVATGTCPGSLDSVTVTITEPTAIIASISTQSNGCNNANNGTASVTATGGYTPYTYSWTTTPVQTTAAATGLAPGTYTCSVFGASILSGVATPPACYSPAIVTITNPTALTTSIASQTNVLCFGNTTGAAAVTATGGTSPLSYIWSNGGTTTSLSNLAVGSYTLTVTDANLCTQTQVVTITQPVAALATTIGSQTNINCNGGNNGGATIIVTGGTTNYAYLWSNGGTTNSLSSITAGNYTLTVTDGNACTRLQVVAITQPNILASMTSALSNVLCFGSSTGSTTVAPSGGTTPYYYLWSTGGTNANLTGLAAGTYHLTITDAHNCLLNRDVIISQPSSALTATTSQVNVGCLGASTGSVTALPSGGTPPYFYLWSNSATTASITGLANATYGVTVTDANGCTPQTASATITQPTSGVVASAGTNDTTCSGAPITIGGNPSATGGTSPYAYSWSPATALNSAVIANPAASPTVATTYVLNVTDYNGCTSTSSVNVLLYPAPAVPTITVTFDTLHSSAGLTYQWYKDGNIINGATSNSYIVPVNGNYTVVITDANGCTSVSVPYVFNSTGVNDIKNVSDKFMVFPNPATDELNITSKFGSSSSLNLDIIDIYGQVVYHYQLVNDNTTISLSTINSGIYLIRISNGETTVVKRFTKLSSN